MGEKKERGNLGSTRGKSHTKIPLVVFICSFFILYMHMGCA